MEHRVPENPLKAPREYLFIQWGDDSRYKHLTFYQEMPPTTICGMRAGENWIVAERATTLKGDYCRDCERLEKESRRSNWGGAREGAGRPADSATESKEK